VLHSALFDSSDSHCSTVIDNAHDFSEGAYMNNILPAIGGVISGVFAIVIGYFKGRSGDSSATTIPAISQELTSCADACAQLDSSRQANCLAADALAAANTSVGSLNSQVATAWTVAGVLWAASVAAAVIAVVGWAIALALAIVASAATAFALYLTGLLIAAQDDQSSKQSTATMALQAVIDARNVVMTVCKGQELTDCLNRPSPCG
jgi:hypothetical protein